MTVLIKQFNVKVIIKLKLFHLFLCSSCDRSNLKRTISYKELEIQLEKYTNKMTSFLSFKSVTINQVLFYSIEYSFFINVKLLCLAKLK